MRHPRIVEPGYPHHIILRGNNRRRIFSYDREFRLFIRMVGEQGWKHGVQLHCMCAMPNHGHLIMTPQDKDSLSSCVGAFSHQYAWTRNRRRDGSGHLFEGRFRSIVIDSERYLAACTAYLELNPVRAGIVEDATAWRWSTYRLQIGDVVGSHVPPEYWTPSPWYLALGNTPEERVLGFREWMRTYDGSGIPEKHAAEIASAEALSAPYTRRLERPGRKRAV